MPRRADAVSSNGDKTIHVDGVYQHVLRKLCERDAHAGMPDYLLLPDDEAAAAWERELQARIDALMAERDGNPVRVQSYMLPDGLPPPFDPWPGRRRSFLVGPDDSILLRSFGAFE